MLPSVQYLSKDQEEELRRTARQLVAPGKGILAADEPPGDTHSPNKTIFEEKNALVNEWWCILFIH